MKYFKMDMVTGSLTNGTSSVTAFQIGGGNVAATFEGVFVGFSWTCTDGSPDGLISVSVFNKSSNGLELLNDKVADMGTANSQATSMLSVGIPFHEGLYFTVTGDGDSDGKGYAITPYIQQLER